MDAIQQIQKDHRDLEALFKRFERAEREDDDAAQGAIAREVVRELSIHAAIEEQLVYPALRGAGEERAVLDALEEHHAAKVTLDEIDALGPSSERFASKVHVLVASVRQHVAEEEQTLLPRLERALDADRRRVLGEALAQARKVAPTRPHPAAPDTPPGVFVAGAIAAVYDRLRDALRGATALLRGLAGRTLSIGVGGVRGLATEAQARGREAVEAAGEAADRGRAVLDEVEGGVTEATGRVRASARAAAREARTPRGRGTRRRNRRNR